MLISIKRKKSVKEEMPGQDTYCQFWRRKNIERLWFIMTFRVSLAQYNSTCNHNYMQRPCILVLIWVLTYKLSPASFISDPFSSASFRSLSGVCPEWFLIVTSLPCRMRYASRASRDVVIAWSFNSSHSYSRKKRKDKYSSELKLYQLKSMYNAKKVLIFSLQKLCRSRRSFQTFIIQ